MTEMVLPQFGMGMTDGTITAWHKAEGDAVVRGEPLCDVEAAKTTVEVGAPVDGILQKIFAPAGTNVPVNTVIALIGDEGASSEVVSAPQGVSTPAPPAAPSPVQLEKARASRTGTTAPKSPLPSAGQPRQGTQVEPRARRAARERNLDLSLIEGSGPGGRIIEEDVIRAAQHALPAPIAGRVEGYNTSFPMAYQLRMRCDVSSLKSLFEGIWGKQENAVSLTSVLVKTSSLALAQAGVANGQVCVRSDDGTMKWIKESALLSLRAIEVAVSEEQASSGLKPSIVIETIPEGWLESVIRFDAGSPVSLSASPFPAPDDGPATDWQLILTASDAGMTLAEAKAFLRALQDMLENPLLMLA